MKKKLFMQIEFREKKYSGTITYDDEDCPHAPRITADAWAHSHLESLLIKQIYDEYKMNNEDVMSRASRLFDDEVEKAVMKTKLKELEAAPDKIAEPENERVQISKESGERIVLKGTDIVYVWRDKSSYTNDGDRKVKMKAEKANAVRFLGWPPSQSWLVPVEAYIVRIGGGIYDKDGKLVGYRVE